jgi:hypothetical protein
MMIETQMESVKMKMLPSAGMMIFAVRNDGRTFKGMIEKVRETSKGTMVVIFEGWSNGGKDYSTVYLEACSKVEMDDYRPVEV